MLELCTLASGSSGNCLLVSSGSTRVLVDAGISCRRITTALRGLGVDPASLSAVLHRPAAVLPDPLSGGPVQPYPARRMLSGG